DVRALWKYTVRQTNEGDIAFRIDPVEHAALAVLTEGLRRGQRAELMMTDDITAQSNTQTEIGRRGFPVAGDRVLAVQLVDLHSGAIDEHLLHCHGGQD